MKGMGRGSMECTVLPGPFLGHLKHIQQGCHLPHSCWDPPATSVPVLWNLGSKAALTEKDMSHH